MNYLYGVNWHEQLRKPIREMDEKAARRKFVSGPQLSVSAGPDLAHGVIPDYTLLIGENGCALGSSFYDQHGSIAAAYHYAVPDEGPPDQMFLAQVNLWLYPSDDRLWDRMHSKATSIFQFRPDGWARRRFAVKGAPNAHLSEFTDVDVSTHWTPIITFGDWDRFGIRPEPSLPGDDIPDAPPSSDG